MSNRVGHQKEGVECDEAQRKVAVGSSVSLVQHKRIEQARCGGK